MGCMGPYRQHWQLCFITIHVNNLQSRWCHMQAANHNLYMDYAWLLACDTNVAAKYFSINRDWLQIQSILVTGR